MTKPLDLITVGRASVDLYGGQVGGRLEDMASFNKYIGGSPTNIAVGTARLGLKSALITRVGDEHMGRFIREELEREGVDVRGVTTDSERLTALAILGIRDQTRFPLVFYRENCADMALSDSDMKPELIAEARCFCVTGTHLSNPRTETAIIKAVRIARDKGVRTALDIDYRPNLWGLAGHGLGESRYIKSKRVTERLQKTLDLFDLVVGTEEEFHIAGGSGDTLVALASVRELTSAVLVCKRGPLGAVMFNAAIPGDLNLGQSGPGFEVEVFNVLGAGDGFMAGLLTGWLSGKDWHETLRIANACGALAVSRHGCAPSYPSREELEFFLQRGVVQPALRHDNELERVHWSTTPAPGRQRLCILDCSLSQPLSAALPDTARLAAFQGLCLEAVREAAHEQPSVFGILIDDRTGRTTLHDAAERGLWVGRVANDPLSAAWEIDPGLGADFGALAEWPLRTVVHLSVPALDGASLPAHDIETLVRFFAAARRCRLETMVRIVPPDLVAAGDAYAYAVRQFYRHGVYPDWWVISTQPGKVKWARLAEIIETHDRHMRGILVSGHKVRRDGQYATAPVKGFITEADWTIPFAEAWCSGQLSDRMVVAELAKTLKSHCAEFYPNLLKQ